MIVSKKKFHSSSYSLTILDVLSISVKCVCVMSLSRPKKTNKQNKNQEKKDSILCTYDDDDDASENNNNNNKSTREF